MWAIVRRIRIREHERGLVFRENSFEGVLRPGVHWRWDPLDLIARSRELRLEANPTLMRLREREVLEKIAGTTNLSVVVGEGGLADRVVKLL